MKRCFTNKKIKLPTRGIDISQFTVLRVICVPLLIAAVDIATDTGLLLTMWSYVYFYQHDGLGDDRVWYLHGLGAVFVASVILFIISMFNLVLGNPGKTLIRNVQTSVAMESRKLESKSISPSVGEHLRKEYTHCQS